MYRDRIALAAITILLLVAPPAINSQTREEVGLWQSIQNSTNPDDIQAYLDKYPEGTFAPLAKRRLATLLEAKRANVGGSGWEGRAHFRGNWMGRMKAAPPTDPKAKSFELKFSLSQDGTCVAHGIRPCTWKQMGDSVIIIVPRAKGKGLNHGCDEEYGLQLDAPGTHLSGTLVGANNFSFSCDGGGTATVVLTRRTS